MLCSYPTYEEWKPIFAFFNTIIFYFVLILPMRNGNQKRAAMQAVHPGVLILPMRNGNRMVGTPCFEHGKSSYPTYEEWKRLPMQQHKCGLLVLILPMRNGNKNSSIIKTSLNFGFLSYLWEMETHITKGGHLRDFPVLILPMRNGNVLNL